MVLIATRGDAAETPGAFDKALPCRPTIACTADIVAPGSFELESGMLFRKLAGDVRQWSFPFLAKLTLAEWVQLQVGSNGFTTQWAGAAGHLEADRARFFDDIQLGAKFHLVDQKTLVPSLSFSAALSVPTVDALGYVRTTDALFIGYVTKDVGPVHGDLNLGLNALALEDSPVVQPWTALAISVEPIARFGAMVEGYVFASARPEAKHDAGILFALSASPRPWLVFDAGGDVGGYPGDAREFSVFVGMTVVPVVLWRAKR
jgi:hypothetical protein